MAASVGSAAAWVLLVMASFSGAAGKPAGPSLKWAQDTKKIFLTVGMGCKSNVKFEPTQDTFALSCKDAAGKSQRYSAVLREDIVEKDSFCKSVRGEEICTLQKKYEHFWDRLPHDINDMKQLKQDWSKWKDDSDDHSADEIYSSPTDQKYVKTVDTAGFEKVLKDSSVVFVDASLPWCTKCAFTRKAFTAAAKQLGGSSTTYGKQKPVSFVYVNTREVREAARTFNVSCDFPCKFYVVRDNALDKAEDVEAKGQESDIVSAIESRLSPLLTKVSSEQEAQDFSKLHAVSCLVSLSRGVMSSAEHSAEYKAAEKAAQVLRGKVAIMYTDKGIGGLKAPGAQAWVNSSSPRKVELSTDGTTLARNMVAMTWGYSMFNYTWSKRELFDAVQLPVAHAFLDDKPAPEMVEMMEAAAAEMRGKMAFVRFSRKDSYLLKEFGLSEEALPAFGIADTFAASGKRYGMEDDWLGPPVPTHIPDPAAQQPDDWNEDDDGEWEAPLVDNPEYSGQAREKRFSRDTIVKFAQQYVDGKLTPSYKSEFVPSKDAPEGQVRTVVWKNSAQQGAADSSEAVLVALYKPYAASKAKLMGVLDKIAHAFSKLPEMRIAKMDTSKNHVDVNRFLGFEEHSQDASLYLCHQGKVTLYKGSLAQADILKFLAKNVKAVKAGWEEKVKPVLKEVKDAIAAQKRKAEEEKERKEKEAADEKKRIDDLLAGAEKIDVSKAKDKGIIKQIIQEGEGQDSPEVGAEVQAHYTGTLLDGTKFDSSRDRGQPFEFELGKGAVIACWDQAMATMKKGERAFLTCTSSYAYGERGAGGTIPPGATLRFDVELVSWSSAGGDAGAGGIKVEL